MKIIVASKNPVKITATTFGFQKMFPEALFDVAGIAVSGGVRDQPMSDAETLLGARRRAERAYLVCRDADYWVGIEGGVEEREEGLAEFAWVVVKGVGSMLGRGKTGSFFLPPRIADLIRAGRELGEADDIVFGRNNSKQENGAVGILTGNVIDRTSYCAEAVILALIPFKNGGLYEKTVDFGRISIPSN